MPERKLPHLFLNELPEASLYTSPRTGRDNINLPPRSDRAAHANVVRAGLDRAWKKSEREREARRAVSLPSRGGTYIEFESAPGFDLNTKSLDSSGIKLLTVSQKRGKDDVETTFATVFVPEGKEAALLKKVDAYQSEDTKSGLPKNRKLVESIEALRAAVIDSFWRDRPKLKPEATSKAWCEIWLRVGDDYGAVVDAFRDICETLEIELKVESLSFPERAVVLALTSANDLESLLQSSDSIAEFRRAKETADFWLDMSNAEQSDWVQALAGRLSVAENAQATACIVDTGVNNSHPLLNPILTDDDCHSVNPEWNTADEHGHGTLMCGLAAFGDRLETLLQGTESFELPYKLESVKLIQRPGQHHEKELYGHWTKRAVSRAEIQNPQLERAVCLAVTSEDGRDEGRPSSWSGSIDQMTSGADDERRRLLIVSSGNIRDSREWGRYPDSNITNAVHDPAQAWNALTVGSYTTKDRIENDDLRAKYEPVAEAGQLSPYSTTSLIWDTKWPNKPDVVLEGGNAGIDSTGFASEIEGLSLLSLNAKPQSAHFAHFVATSASAALMAEQAARIMARYPEAWPETVRALIVHSASWPEQLWKQFEDLGRTKKQNIERMLRVCGYGVPDFERAIASRQNSLTLIAEQTIQPFCCKDSGREYQTKDMHLYRLPWPKEVLEELPGETPVRIDVTLSYFIEPGPGEIGWRDKYRYRSHGLDFNVKAPLEEEEIFVQRLNKSARNEDEYEGGGSSVPWEIGINGGRTRGSIHRDWWLTNAAQAAESNVVGVFPRTGWWKERYHLEKGESNSRYSLIVSLSTTDQTVDIYTPVALKIAPEVPTAVTIDAHG